MHRLRRLRLDLPGFGNFSVIASPMSDEKEDAGRLLFLRQDDRFTDSLHEADVSCYNSHVT